MKINSKFNVFIRQTFSSSDEKVLTLLYQPLIGLEAYALYQTLYNLTLRNSDEYIPISTILDILNIKNKKFNSLREKLEAVGLLETFVDTNTYHFMLKPPFSARQFLLNTILGKYLESEIGEDNLEFIANIFKIKRPDLKSYKNISKSFDELYQFKRLNLLNLDYEIEGRNGESTKLIRNAIDYKTFVKRIPRAYQGPKLASPKFRDEIQEIAYVYQFSLEQMVEVYKNAHHNRNEITVDAINFQAQQLYEKDSEVVVTKKTNDLNTAIKNATYKEVVQKFGKESFRGLALSTIYEFRSRNDIDPGILNVLIAFILKNKDGVLPNVNYLDKVWQSWVSNGVRTVEDAINYKNSLEKRYNKSNYSNRSQIKRDQPEWLDEYMKEINEMEG